MIANNRKNEDKLTQKEQNIASNKAYRKNHDIKRWHRFWLLFGTLFLISEFILSWVVKIALEIYVIISLIAMIALTANFLGSTFTAVEYDPLKRAICHMGRLRSYHGIKNTKSVALWIGFGFSGGILGFFLGELMTTHYFNSTTLFLVGLIGYFGSIIVIMVTLIPIDVHRKYHLISSFILFLIPLSINILVFTYLLYEGSLQIFLFFPLLQWISSALYAIGYIKRYMYTAIFQKSCLLMGFFSIYLYINIFSAILL
jgi:hypothetical protein